MISVNVTGLEKDMMRLNRKAQEKLEDLLDMSQVNFEEMSARWDELQPQSFFNVKNSDNFLLGYVFGKIEHKFIDWFYAEFGRSQTDEEYKDFWNIVSKHTIKIEKII